MGMTVEEFSLKVKKLKLLLDNKLIKEEEFEQIKNKLINDMRKGDKNAN